ncbi:MAG: Rab family GTPase [Candidatus Odinarchaeota archaeon]
MFVMKVVLAGDGSVGKTALRERYLGRGFKSSYVLTVGADFAVKNAKIGNKNFQYQIWDLAGQPRFDSVRGVYYRGCAGALLVFDITRPDSFENLQKWVDEVWRNNGRGMVPIIILGNKSDLQEQFPEHITVEQIEKYTDKLSRETLVRGFAISYMPTSAKIGLNVDQSFELLGSTCLQRESSAIQR